MVAARARPTHHLVRARSALNRVDGMPFRWSLNPYRGCLHDCLYCYARVTHSYLDLPLSDFGRVVVVKSNLPALLRRELKRRSWRGESIAIGTATDPYQPAEGTFKITRGCLEVLAEAANPCSVTTKGTLLVRDLDLMQELAETTDFVVHLTLVTLDPGLSRRLEPGAPPPASRLKALARLRAAGVPFSVFLAPIIPGLTDRSEQLAEVVRAAADHGARGVWPGVLRLAPGVKDWFLDFLDREYPALAESYRRGYGARSDAPAWYRAKIDQRVQDGRQGLTFSPLAEDRPRGRRTGQLSFDEALLA